MPRVYVLLTIIFTLVRRLEAELYQNVVTRTYGQFTNQFPFVFLSWLQTCHLYKFFHVHNYYSYFALTIALALSSTQTFDSVVVNYWPGSCNTLA